MPDPTTLVASKTFTADLITHGSWGSNQAGRHESTMEFWLRQERTTGYIEWDIPSMQETECIGLWFDIEPDGALTLTDYDGVMALPMQAIELLRSNGVTVTEDFE